MTAPDNRGPNNAGYGADGPLIPPPPLTPPSPISGAQYFAAQNPPPQSGGPATQAGIPNSPPSYAAYGASHSPQGPYPPGSPPPPGWNQPPPYPGPGQQYGGGAYPFGPYNPYGYAQPPLGTSGMAIASLITGICGLFCITPLISIGLGIAALSDIRKTGRPGKGLAIAGLIISALWIALIAFVIATGHTSFNTNTPQPTTTQGPNGTSA